MRIYGFITLFSVGVLLGACGGGGGGGSDSSFPRSGVEADITAENAELIAASVVAAVDAAGAASLLSGEPGLLLSYQDTENYAVVTVLNRLSAVNDKQYAPTDVNALEFIDVPRERCQVSGFVDISADIQDPAAFVDGFLSVGDEFFTDFDNCNEGDGIVLDGGFDFVVTDFSGNIFGSIELLGLDIDFTRLRITEDGEGVTFDGGINLTSDSRIAGTDITSIDGNSVVVSVPGVKWEQRNFSQSYTESASGYTVEAAGTLETTLFTGSVTYNTDPSFTGPSESDPEAGLLNIYGVDNEYIRLTAIGQGSVTVEVDADGDGQFDGAPINTTWDALDEVLENAI